VSSAVGEVRRVLLVVNTRRDKSREVAAQFCSSLGAHGLSLRVAMTVLIQIPSEKLALMTRSILCFEEGRSIYRYGPYAFAEMHIVEIGATASLG